LLPEKEIISFLYASKYSFGNLAERFSMYFSLEFSLFNLTFFSSLFFCITSLFSERAKSVATICLQYPPQSSSPVVWAGAVDSYQKEKLPSRDSTCSSVWHI